MQHFIEGYVPDPGEFLNDGRLIHTAAAASAGRIIGLWLASCWYQSGAVHTGLAVAIPADAFVR
jgi:hypothetical protein